MSTLTQRLDDYLVVRRSLGYDLSHSARVLRRFTAFADCEGMDQAKPNLCKSHCEASSQSDNSLPHPTPDAPVLPLLAVIAQPDAHRPLSVSIQGDLFASIATPPTSIRFCVLRI